VDEEDKSQPANGSGRDSRENTPYPKGLMDELVDSGKKSKVWECENACGGQRVATGWPLRR